jgi:hypothetical protein
MRLRIIFLVSTLSIFQISCATTYQKDSFTGGYDETQLSGNMWRVGFKGNAFTGTTKNQDFLMYRNAELTKEKGYKYFLVKSESSDVETSIHTTQGYYDFVTKSQTGGTIQTYNKPSSQNTIIMFKEKPQSAYMVYEPEIIINSIKAKYPSDFKDKHENFSIKDLSPF